MGTFERLGARLAVWLCVSCVAGCGKPKPMTQADACRIQAVMQGVVQAGAEAVAQPHSTPAQTRMANTLEQQRCDNIEARERAEAREDAREQRQMNAEEQARQDRLDRQLELELARIRHSPKTPELGSTIAEVKVMCEHQRSQLSNKDGVLGCSLRRVPLFSCSLDQDQRVDQCTTFYEGVEMTDVKQKIEEHLGAPDHEEVDDNGFRIFEWSEVLSVSMYPRGVRITKMKPPPKKASAPSLDFDL